MPRLNRTFYGIETVYTGYVQNVQMGLNRTFYGIETIIPADKACVGNVLIVPFMELKQDLYA